MSQKILYITRNGTRLTKEALRFQVRYKGEIKQEIPAHQLGQIIIIGKADITHDAIMLACKRNIDIVFFTQNGKLKTHLFPPNERMIKLRMAQMQLSPEKQLDFVKKLIAAKINNQRILLTKRSKDGFKELAEYSWRMKQMIDALDEAVNIEQIRGFEGGAAAAYFSGYGMLLGQDMGFYGRKARPPRDPVNALLSFGYAILYQQVLKFVSIYGLDPYMGYLHVPQDRRLSLALDLMEEFRPLIIDRVVMRLINRVQLTTLDFVDTEEGIRMSQKAISILIREIENRLMETVTYGPRSQRISWKLTIQRQVALFRRFVLGETEHYEGFKVR